MKETVVQHGEIQLGQGCSGMRILFATSECVPFAKTGGLADVCGSLPKHIARLGHHVFVFMPNYQSVKNSGMPLTSTGIEFEIPIGTITHKRKQNLEFLRSILALDLDFKTCECFHLAPSALKRSSRFTNLYLFRIF